MGGSLSDKLGPIVLRLFYFKNSDTSGDSQIRGTYFFDFHHESSSKYSDNLKKIGAGLTRGAGVWVGQSWCCIPWWAGRDNPGVRNGGSHGRSAGTDHKHGTSSKFQVPRTGQKLGLPDDVGPLNHD